MTRHRKSARLYSDLIAHPTLNALKKAMSREGLKDSVLDYPLAFAARRGIDIDSIGDRFRTHVIGKLKGMADKLRDQVEKTLNLKTYLARRSQELEYRKTIQETLSRREDAKLVAAYMNANRKVGEAWRTLSSYRQHLGVTVNQIRQKEVDLLKGHPALVNFQNAQVARDQLSAEIYSRYGKYTKMLEYHNISLEKLQKQASIYNAREKIKLSAASYKDRLIPISDNGIER